MQRLELNKTNVSKIHKIPWINFSLGGLGNETKFAKWAVFFGEDYKNESSMDRIGFINKTNSCLDYMRRNCFDCKLIYKPHPAETYEPDLLNLIGFEIIKNAGISEMFLWKNAPHIKYVFSVRSTSALSAYQLGFNSYLFFRFFESAFHNKIAMDSTKAWFKNMPESSFIDNMNQRILENKAVLVEDPELKENFAKMLSNRLGKIWIIVDHSAFIVSIISIARLIKELDDSREIILIVMRHHRWDIVDFNDFSHFFNEIIMFPRIFYSLRPIKILDAIKVARKIKEMNVESSDIVIDFGNHDFVANCFISYHKKILKVVFLPKLLEDVYFKTNYLSFLDDGRDFKFTKASLFYNKILEPILALHKTIFKQGGDGHVGNILRFEQSITEIYDQVYLF